MLTVAFTVLGIPCLGLNGGSAFQQNEAFSFQVATDDRAETDRLWNAIISNGGKASEFGWCKGKWELSSQITPRALTAAFNDPEPAAAKLAFDATTGRAKSASPRSGPPGADDDGNVSQRSHAWLRGDDSKNALRPLLSLPPLFLPMGNLKKLPIARHPSDNQQPLG